MTLVPDIFETTYPGAKLIDFIERLTKITSIYKGLTIVTILSTFRQISYLNGLFEYHLKFDFIDNSIVVRLLKPIRTPFYGVVLEKRDGFPNIKFYQIV